jgi:lipopolysaccharide transport system permease protein
MNTSGLTRILALLNPVRLVVSLWPHRNLMRQIVARELTQRYRGSYLGILWSFLVPLLMMTVYTFVFSVIFKARWRTGAADGATGEFALTLFAGLTAFNVFGEALGRAPSIILSVPNYVKKVVFPLEILPVVAVGSALINSFIGAGLVIIGAGLLMHQVSSTLFLLPLAYLPLIFLSLGLTWFLASLGVYVRDIAQFIGIVVQVLFFLSPVFYPVSAVPAKFQPWLLANPLSPILESFRRCLLWSQPLDWLPWAAWTLGTAAIALLGYAWFMRTKKGFADVV